MKTIYLDYAAATPVDVAVVKAMQPYLSDKFYNPSATYLAGQAVGSDIEVARQIVAKWLGAKPAEIIFTAGGTEANNLAISGVMQAFPGSNVVTSSIEHESVLKPAQAHKHKLAKVSPDGIVNIADLKHHIDNDTVLVSIIYANNEIGTIQPIRQISQLIAKIRQRRVLRGNKTPLYFHIDACQAGAYLDLHTSRLGVDLMTINGGKIYGPKQSGALYVKVRTRLIPQILGGGQEFGIRSGTQNVAAIIGLAKALDLVQQRRKQEVLRLQKLQNLFIELCQLNIPSAKINGSLSQRLPNNVQITIPNTDNEQLMMRLDERGVICAVGSACSASSNEPSHVLKAIGLGDKAARSSLRFSFGSQTKETEIRQAINTLLKCL